jgi:hypothetical protein
MSLIAMPLTAFQKANRIGGSWAREIHAPFATISQFFWRFSYEFEDFHTSPGIFHANSAILLRISEFLRKSGSFHLNLAIVSRI